MQRRSFLKTIGGVAAAAPFLQAGASGLRLGYDTYSIRNLKWPAIKHIEYAASLKLDTIQNSAADYESFEPAYLAKLKDAGDRAGLQLELALNCICPTSAAFNKDKGPAEEYLLSGLRASRAIGAKAMRCFVGSMTERRGKLPVDAHIESTLKVFKNVRSQALDTGVKIALENHNGDLSAAEVRYIVETAGKDLVGVNFDSANPMWLLEDPMQSLETLAPYIVTSHFRDSAIWEGDQGIYFQWVTLGEGTVDMPALVARFRELCPGVPMQLETITGRPPTLLPCYSKGAAFDEFWKAYPKVSGAQFARFAALAKKGRPYAGPMLTASTAKQPAEYDAAITMQQKVDLDRSLEYAKNTLQAGIRNR